MASCLGGLCSEKRHEGKDPLVDADHDLFVELAALGKRCRIAKVVDVEKLRSPFRGGADNVGSEILNCLNLIVHVEAECMGHFRLDAEDGLDLPVSESDRAVVEDKVEIRLDLRFIVFKRRDLVNGIFDRDFWIDDLHFIGRRRGGDAPFDTEDRSGVEMLHFSQLVFVFNDDLDESASISKKQEGELS